MISTRRERLERGRSVVKEERAGVASATALASAGGRRSSVVAGHIVKASKHVEEFDLAKPERTPRLPVEDASR